MTRPYDEKVLAQFTLYGLPMARVDVPNAVALHEPFNEPDPPCQVADSRTGPDGLTARGVTCHLDPQRDDPPQGSVATGTYYTIAGETEVNEGQPIQPRTGVTITLTGQTPHGAFFESGSYRTIASFDPVVTRVVTDDTGIDLWQTEPDYMHPDVWQPPQWSLVNQVRTGESAEQRLVLIPAQYRSQTASRGTERLFEEMTYTLYYTTTTDIIPPSVWQVYTPELGRPDEVAVEVEVTDLSDVVRVAVSYTAGDGMWATVDLERQQDRPNFWRGEIPRSDALEWFVQALDGAGNVAVADNKAAYYGAQVEPPPQVYPTVTPTPRPTATATPTATQRTTCTIWLPVASRSNTTH